MQRIKDIMIAVLLIALAWVWNANAGEPGGPGTPPDSTTSYSIEDLYNRLDAGTDGSPATFAEPSAAAGTGTMHTLNDVMDKAPAKDDTDGATTAQVLRGKKFWGLNVTSNEWGLQTGSMTNYGAVTIGPGASDVTIGAAYYSSVTVTGDSDLTAANIKKDVDIFGVTGTFEGGPTCSGTLNGTRWCDNGDGTVTDMTTGLVWLKKADWGGTKKIYESGGAGVENAHDRASSLKAGAEGADLSDGSIEGDWRLPTLSELKGLTSGDEKVSSSSMRAFTGVQTANYWSSSTYTGNPADGWIVYLNGGYVNAFDKANGDYVWPVRGGQ